MTLEYAADQLEAAVRLLATGEAEPDTRLQTAWAECVQMIWMKPCLTQDLLRQFKALWEEYTAPSRRPTEYEAATTHSRRIRWCSRRSPWVVGWDHRGGGCGRDGTRHSRRSVLRHRSAGLLAGSRNIDERRGAVAGTRPSGQSGERERCADPSVRALRRGVGRPPRECRQGDASRARRGALVDALGCPGFIAERDGSPVGILTYLLDDQDAEIVFVEATTKRSGIGSAARRRVLGAGDGSPACRHREGARTHRLTRPVSYALDKTLSECRLGISPNPTVA